MPTRYAPSPVIVPATGPATAGGYVLSAINLGMYKRDSDNGLDLYETIFACALRARADCFLLCLRPTTDRPACVDLGAHAFADASLQPDFSARALVVDPYDADGGDIRDRAPVSEVAAAA